MLCMFLILTYPYLHDYTSMLYNELMNKEKLRKELSHKKTIEDCAIAFGIVGDESRLKICYLLCKYPELSVGDIAEIIELSLSATSRSLDKLKQLEVVKSRKDTRKVFYSLTQNQLSKIIRKSLKIT